MRSRDTREQPDVAVVVAARAGDPHASDQLLRACLPLVYNIVGRALDGHGDVDDVVQETMVRVLDGLPGLEHPDRFRSWLVAITVRQIRDRWRGGRTRFTAVPLEETAQEADPQADFVDLAILRLALSGQRREAVEATRWLEDEEREVLALWWMETAGELTRGELSAACGLTPQHTAVRVQRVKERLESARTVVRAVTASPRCPVLATVLTSWGGRPSALWRKRLARHVRDCARCRSSTSDLIPAEGLLGGLALVPVPVGLTGLVLTRVSEAGSAAETVEAGVRTTSGAGGTTSGAGRTAHTFGGLAAKPVVVAVVGAVTLAAAGVAWYTATRSPDPAPRPAAVAPSSPAAPSVSPSSTTPASPKPTPTPTRTPTPTPTPTRTTAPTTAPTAAAARFSGPQALRSVDVPGSYVSRSGRFGALNPVGATSSAAARRAATFTFVPGLADPRCYSLRDGTGRYLRHYAFRIRLDTDDGSAIFREDATFCARSGSTGGSVSLESYNYPGRYLRHREDLQLWLDPAEDTAAYRTSRSFSVVAPWV
ncbi:sigma-70 family RNA polymerase sigma factor [Streptomyces sp. SP18BB07]|uniref:sigma-70 family RNA polymerase sigma factor n=1 Tax=Streptomyces sp. SP18BB07 TaxID=3002522 RepID=UPI002E79C01A|nr:sigma-70 family RNA polymerase sigma factor [Streptomyces sp. SP18BB07]MEE1758743.1 sigma-70 family RNA polymerase sigma factor [Streptomyces sp. SP18BB07]